MAFFFFCLVFLLLVTQAITSYAQSNIRTLMHAVLSMCEVNNLILPLGFCYRNEKQVTQSH